MRKQINLVEELSWAAAAAPRPVCSRQFYDQCAHSSKDR